MRNAQRRAFPGRRAGLTKREYIAAQVMAALVNNPSALGKGGQVSMKQLAVVSLEAADALLVTLDGIPA